MTMKMSDRGRAALIQREGVRLKAYRDSVGILTIGVGHTSMAGPPRVTPGLTITRAECDAIFARDLVKYERTVNAAVTVPVSQNAFDAMVSLCYNIGQGGFAKSSVVRRLNAGDKHGAADAFLMWVHPAALRGRREAERKQFLAPDNPVANQPRQPNPKPAPISQPTPAPQPAPTKSGFFVRLARLLRAA